MPKPMKKQETKTTTNDTIRWTDLSDKEISMLYNEEYDKFSTQISRKKQDSEEYENMYIRVLFSNKAQDKLNTNWDNYFNDKNVGVMKIKSGWLSFFDKYVQVFINEVE